MRSEDGLFERCPGCSTIFLHRELVANLKVCKTCGYHIRLSASDRLNWFLDVGTLEEHDVNIASGNPLGWDGFDQVLGTAVAKTGQRCAVVSGGGLLSSQRIQVFATDFGFLGGTIGSAEGEKIVRVFDRASRQDCPVVGFVASGGARVQEGLFSLMQVPKIVAAIRRYRLTGRKYVSVLLDPTMGGPMISFAIMGDLRLAEPRARVSFAGARVKGHANETTAEHQQDWGLVHEVVERNQIKRRVIDFLAEG